MLGGDRGLQRVRAGGAARRGVARELEARRDLAAVPERAVLVFEQDQLAAVVEPRLTARVVSSISASRPSASGSARQHRDQRAGEADRLAAELAAHQRLVGGGQVALVEDQVERREHGRQPVGHLIAAGTS